MPIYKKTKTKEISFPLGGIGSGCIGLAGNGRLIDFEIFNRPNKGSNNGFTHFAIKAEKDGKLLDARVLNSDLQPPYSGFGHGMYNNFGFGVDRSTLVGLPHFKDAEFIGEFPLAKINFIDKSFPGKISLNAFNPFIPLNDMDSSIPAAFFEIDVENTTDENLDYTLAFSFQNPLKPPIYNTYQQISGNYKLMRFENKADEKDISFGDFTIATDAKDTDYQEYWYRGAWFDNIGVFWRDFIANGELRKRTYDDKDEKAQRDHGTISAKISLKPNEIKHIRFILSWNMPNFSNYWNPADPAKLKPCDCDDPDCHCNENPNVWKNYYATLFKDSSASAIYSLKNFDRLYNETKLFKDSLFSTTIPAEAIDAISANISILKTPTVVRLTDGTFYAFEGCHGNAGCCEGSCIHVWNYAYAMPFLFPKLERSMREVEFIHSMNEDGKIGFRAMLPLKTRDITDFRACADGQYGAVIKVYRDYKICGDIEWLKRFWPQIKLAISYTWSPNNPDKWDPDKSGVLTGRQHHTLDMELFSPNSWLTGLYLAALKAAAEIAVILGEESTAKEYMKIFKKGKKFVDKELFNGEYYYQKIDLGDKSIIDKYPDAGNYWLEESSEIKYQIGEGSAVDQVLAGYHSALCGLGEIYNKKQMRSALKSIYKYNFKKMDKHFNPCRIYCLNDEKGVTICEWPEGKRKPIVPAPYSEETMHGFEYQAAVHMITEGMLKQGLDIVKALRMRYDGERRNPFNEFECGSNYARSMASYGLLLAYSGFKYDMSKNEMSFNPMINKDNFKSFWSTDKEWGIVEIKDGKTTKTTLYTAK